MIRSIESSSLPWLSSWGFHTPRFICLTDGQTLPNGLASELGEGPWVVKPDTARGGKGQAGLVKICATLSELAAAVSELASPSHTAGPSERVIVQEYVDGSECYASVAFDETARAPLMRLAAAGGVGFDALRDAASVPVDPMLGLLESDVNQLLAASGIGRGSRHGPATRRMLHQLWRAFSTSEATLIEVNPFRVDGETLTAVGVALEFDDHADEYTRSLRPYEMVDEDRFRLGEVTERERAVFEINRRMSSTPAVSFIELPGEIALLISGGGGALLCMDRVTDLGSNAACYVDSSPGAGPEKLHQMLLSGLRVPHLRGVLFGAVVVSLDDVTRMTEAFIRAVRESGFDPQAVPVVARIAGPNEEEAHRLMKEHLPAVRLLGRESTLDDACALIVDLVRHSSVGATT